MKPGIRCAMLVVVMGMLCAGAWGEMTAAQKTEAEGLIKQFTAVEFKAREEAVKRLIEMGPEVLGLVEKAKAETKDEEVKLRCEMVIAGIKKKEATGTAGTGPSAKELLAGARVTIDVKDRPLREVLGMIAAQTGNKAPQVFAEYGAKPVSLTAKEMLYWEAVDKVAAQAGLLMSWDGLAAMDKGEEDVGAYAGPVAVKVVMVRRVHQFQTGIRMGERVDYLEYVVACYTEPRVRLERMERKFTTAVLADGREVAVQPGGYGGAVVSGVISDMVEAGERVKELRGEVEIQLREDGATAKLSFKIENLPVP